MEVSDYLQLVRLSQEGDSKFKTPTNMGVENVLKGRYSDLTSSQLSELKSWEGSVKYIEMQYWTQEADEWYNYEGLFRSAVTCCGGREEVAFVVENEETEDASEWIPQTT